VPTGSNLQLSNSCPSAAWESLVLSFSWAAFSQNTFHASHRKDYTHDVTSWGRTNIQSLTFIYRHQRNPDFTRTPRRITGEHRQLPILHIWSHLHCCWSRDSLNKRNITRRIPKLWYHPRTSISTHFSQYDRPLYVKHNRLIGI